MKIIFLTVILLTQLLGQCFAGTQAPPEIPPSKLTVAKVLEIVQQTSLSTNFMIISIEWCKASEFQPRKGDWHYTPLGDQPNEYSWFVTYVGQGELVDKKGKRTGILDKNKSIGVIRIKDDGSKGVFIGARS